MRTSNNVVIIKLNLFLIIHCSWWLGTRGSNNDLSLLLQFYFQIINQFFFWNSRVCKNYIFLCIDIHLCAISEVVECNL